ncbi:hypothetical protein OF377_02420 [Ureaplasma sp. ES3154-GEN]|uniref:hypothetical protein n=1 Tax=Ureaplasma sp. ES3154-GEN TaxID=2984844 RepID=UPI0021E8D3E3|nr:hypothetical protein [Ureaplasma sp. ES3154-GEN]MCV3743718.1 hypothetical protein [Ureaplasma sp. ES3154-GEN]
MNKWIKHYQASIYLLVIFSLLGFCYFFVASISVPNELNFLADQEQITHNASFMYNLIVEPKNYLFGVNQAFTGYLVLNGHGITMVVLLIFAVLAYIYYLALTIKLKLIRQTLIVVILVQIFYTTMLYLFIIATVQPHIITNAANEYYNYQRTVVLNDTSLTETLKVSALTSFISHYHLPTINDNTSMLNAINNTTINNDFAFYNGSYAYYNGFSRTPLIYFTYVLSALVFITMFIFYLIQIVQLINLLPETVKKVKKPKKQKPNSLNIDKSKKNKKQLIATPDADLERIFQELNL